jgi:tetratricopeptide (TPR) repeat protein
LLSPRRGRDWAIGYFHLAKALRDTGDSSLYPKALDAANRGLALDPDSENAPLGFFIRAEMLDRAGRKEEARRAFQRGKAIEESTRGTKQD